VIILAYLELFICQLPLPTWENTRFVVHEVEDGKLTLRWDLLIHIPDSISSIDENGWSKK